MRHVRDFFRVSPLTNDHFSALRRAIGMLPMVVLLASGHPGLVPFASLGALTSVYGRSEPHRRRLSWQIRGGLLLMVSMSAGLAAAGMRLAPLLLVAATALVAGAGFVVASRTGIAPTSGVYYVLAFGSTAFAASPPPIADALTVGAASVAFAIFVGVAGWVLPGHHTDWRLADDARPGLPPRELAGRALMHVAAVSIAGAGALALGFGHSYWAMMIATVPLAASRAEDGIGRGVHRIVGTLTGLVLAFAVFAVHLAAWQFGVLVVSLRFLMELFVRRNYALSQVFLTPLALLMTDAADPVSPLALIRDRGAETVIGALAGIAIVAAIAAVASERRRAQAVRG